MASIVNAIVVGKVIKPHGIKGHVIVEVLSDSPTRFATGSTLLLGSSPEDAAAVTISSSTPHQGRLIVLLEDLVDRNQAEALRGRTFYVGPEDLSDPGADSFWEHELDGMEVVDVSGLSLGLMTEVLRRDEQDLWVVQTGNGEVLVPAVKQIVVSVDRDTRRITLDPPEGLFS